MTPEFVAWDSVVLRVGGIAALGLMALVSCQGPIKIKPAPPAKITQQPVEQLQGVDSLSPETQQLLRLYGLDSKLPGYPIAVVAVLGGLRGSQLGHIALAAEAEVALLAAQDSPKTQASEIAGWYLLAAARAHEFLFEGDLTPIERAMDPRFQRIRRVYNEAVSSYVSLLEITVGGFQDHEQATRFELFQVDIKLGSDRLDPAAAELLLVARDLAIRGLRNRYQRDGIGAALVAYRPNPGVGASYRFFAPEGFVDPVTAVLEFGPRVGATVDQARAVGLSFYDPRESDSVQIGDLAVPLQADFTTHYAYLVSISEIRAMGRKALLRPEQYEQFTGLFLLEQYDPDKIPIVMIHGLKSSPLAWMELSNDILGDPLLRSRYQIWQFRYPTGLPYLYSGMVLRAELKALRAEFDPDHDDLAMQSMIFIAHSMGGLVARSLVCNSGMEVWDAAFKVPPAEIKGTPQDVEWLRDMFIFSAQPYVDRVVFIATPHRGAEAAGSFLGHLSSSLVELPEYFTERIERLAAQNEDVAREGMRYVIEKGTPNSIQAMRPNHPLTKVVGNLPIDPEIPYHTIMGNRGRDDVESLSDGWVTYESVHLEGAESELVVPAGHDAYGHPGAIAEIMRILRLHLRESNEIP